jgi:hypothetical protein
VPNSAVAFRGFKRQSRKNSKEISLFSWFFASIYLSLSIKKIEIMANLIVKNQEVKFNVGDRVQFYIVTRPDNYAPEYGIQYGVVAKCNKVTMEITGVDGSTYKEEQSKVKHYKDPFENVNK